MLVKIRLNGLKHETSWAMSSVGVSEETQNREQTSHNILESRLSLCWNSIFEFSSIEFYWFSSSIQSRSIFCQCSRKVDLKKGPRSVRELNQGAQKRQSLFGTLNPFGKSLDSEKSVDDEGKVRATGERRIFFSSFALQTEDAIRSIDFLTFDHNEVH